MFFFFYFCDVATTNFRSNFKIKFYLEFASLHYFIHLSTLLHTIFFLINKILKRLKLKYLLNTKIYVWTFDRYFFLILWKGEENLEEKVFPTSHNGCLVLCLLFDSDVHAFFLVWGIVLSQDSQERAQLEPPLMFGDALIEVSFGNQLLQWREFVLATHETE